MKDENDILVAINAKLDLLQAKVDMVYIAVYGVDGQGAIRPEIERLREELMKVRLSLATEKGKIYGGAAAISGFICIITFFVMFLTK